MKGLQARRTAAGLSQEELARRIGCDRTSVTKWETGMAYPAADKLPKIAAVLGCTIDDLYKAESPAEARAV